MRKVLFTLSLAMISILAYCQDSNDSIAISQMKQLGVYYFSNNSLTQITPIMPENTKVSGYIFSAKASMVYEGENSENKMNNTPTFYVYIPAMYKNNINAKQFRMVTLTSKNGSRKLKTASVSPFGAKTGAKSQTMDMVKLNDECFKIFSKEVMPAGHYGIFYNYGNGVPLKLYDFDITE